MSYSLAESKDNLQVPLLVFEHLSKLTSDKNDYLKVALFIIKENEFSPTVIAEKLSITRLKR